MTDATSEIPAPNKTETKVKVTTLMAGVMGIVLAALTAYQDNAGLIPGPEWLEMILFAVVLPGLTYATGYAAPHTYREPRKNTARSVPVKDLENEYLPGDAGYR